MIIESLKNYYNSLFLAFIGTKSRFGQSVLFNMAAAVCPAGGPCADGKHSRLLLKFFVSAGVSKGCVLHLIATILIIAGNFRINWTYNENTTIIINRRIYGSEIPRTG